MGSTPPPGEPERERTSGAELEGGTGAPAREQAPWIAPGAPSAPGGGTPPGAQAPPGGGTPGHQPSLRLPEAGGARRGPLPLHPMTFGDLLDGAFKLLKANLATIVLISALFYVPLDLISAFLTRSLLGGRSLLNLFLAPSMLDETGRISFSSPEFVGGLVAFLLGLVITPLVAAAVSKVVAASYLGETLAAGEAVRSAGRRFWALLGATICVHLIEWVGWFLCIVPGLMAMTFFICTIPALAIEGLGPIKSMRRSFALVRPRFWPVLGIAVVSGILASFLSWVLAAPFTSVGQVIGPRWGFILVAVGSILPALVVSPFVSIVATLVYFDGRIRHEGFDLQLIARDLGYGSAPAR